MTHITICSGEKGEFASCKAIGHSGFAKEGSDIVCSAVTLMLRTTALFLEEKCSFDERLKIELLCQEKGNIEISVVRYGDASFECLVFLFDFLRLGLKSLEDEYPEFVKLEWG